MAKHLGQPADFLHDLYVLSVDSQRFPDIAHRRIVFLKCLNLISSAISSKKNMFAKAWKPASKFHLIAHMRRPFLRTDIWEEFHQLLSFLLEINQFFYDKATSRCFSTPRLNRTRLTCLWVLVNFIPKIRDSDHSFKRSCLSAEMQIERRLSRASHHASLINTSLPGIWEYWPSMPWIALFALSKLSNETNPKCEN